MRTYDKIRIPDDDCCNLDEELQDRDKAIVELFIQLEWIMPYHNDCVADKESLELVDKYADFVAKTRAIYGM